MIYYDRKTKLTINNKESKFLKFLYKTKAGRIILKILTKKKISVLFGYLTDTKISKLYIKKFIKDNDIDIKRYEEKEYKSFNDFFTRKLKKETKKENINKNMLISPCDAKLTVYKINDELTINVKNSIYSIKNLIKDEVPKKYNNGHCLVFRLTPSDYHRYHAFDNLKIKNSKKIEGIFHTVNPISYGVYKVFTENQREVSLLETENFGDVYQIEVGALNVGKIHNTDKKELKKYEEKGYFSFGGSTIILLFEKNKIKIDDDIMEKSKINIESQISYKEIIGKINKE